MREQFLEFQPDRQPDRRQIEGLDRVEQRVINAEDECHRPARDARHDVRRAHRKARQEKPKILLRRARFAKIDLLHGGDSRIPKMIGRIMPDEMSGVNAIRAVQG